MSTTDEDLEAAAALLPHARALLDAERNRDPAGFIEARDALLAAALTANPAAIADELVKCARRRPPLRRRADP